MQYEQPAIVKRQPVVGLLERTISDLQEPL